MSKFYILQEKNEKEDSNYDENVSENFYVYENSIDYSIKKDENEDQIATNCFLSYLKRIKLPERPKQGFYIENKDFVAFKGLGREPSLFFHMLVVPSLEHCYDLESNEIILKNVRDLKFCHIPLLNKMKQECIRWSKRNKKWFYKIFNFTNLDLWFKEDNLQFGFHYPPTVGLLHMHFMIGPVTEHGETQKDRWVSLDKVLENLQDSTNLSCV